MPRRSSAAAVRPRLPRAAVLLLVAAAAASSFPSPSTAFSPRAGPGTRRPRRAGGRDDDAASSSWRALVGPLSATNDDGDDDVPDVDGELLAGQFYEEERRRARASSAAAGADRRPADAASSSFGDGRGASDEGEFAVGGGADEVPRPIRKFTGSSPSLFSNQQSDQPASSNIQREREREFELAGTFERTLGVQAVFLLASLAFVLGVGLTGGITDGSERNFGDLDEYDGTMERYMRTDDAAEAEALRWQRQQQQLQQQPEQTAEVQGSRWM